VSSLPSLTPAFRSHDPQVPWPTTAWPENLLPSDHDITAVVNEAFDDCSFGETHAVIVIQGGKILAERYGGHLVFFDRDPEPITAESTLISWSMGKSMLHFVLGTLVDAGQLDPDAPAPVPEWADPADPRRAITIRHLLRMRDGLDFKEEYSLDQPSDVIQMLFGDGQEDMASFTANKPLAHAPGSFYNYSSGSTNLLSRIVADRVGYGDNYEAYLRQVLFGPLGMNSAIPKFDAQGVFVASSFVYATARDFAKFGLLYLRGGEWEGRQLVTRGWAGEAQIPVSPDGDNFYTQHWWANADRFGSYWANGHEGQRIICSPVTDTVIVRLGKTDEPDYPALRQWWDRLLESLDRRAAAEGHHQQ